MKCSSCNIEISPGYTKALNENSCPACGSPIMSTALYQEFNSIKEVLSTSEVTDADLVKVAALISGKYKLVPRGPSSPANGAAVPSRFQNKTVVRSPSVTDFTTDFDEVEDRDADLAGLPPELQAREKALRDAEEERAIEEWGLNKGEYSTSVNLSSKRRSPDITQENISPEVLQLAELITPSMGGVTDVVPSFGDTSMNAFEAQRLAKLSQLKSDPNYNAIRRIED